MKKESDRGMKILQGFLIGIGVFFLLLLIFMGGQEQINLWEHHPMGPIYYPAY
jgi:hypothetical protein